MASLDRYRQPAPTLPGAAPLSPAPYTRNGMVAPPAVNSAPPGRPVGGGTVGGRSPEDPPQLPPLPPPPDPEEVWTGGGPHQGDYPGGGPLPPPPPLPPRMPPQIPPMEGAPPPPPPSGPVPLPYEQRSYLPSRSDVRKPGAVNPYLSELSNQGADPNPGGPALEVVDPAPAHQPPLPPPPEGGPTRMPPIPPPPEGGGEVAPGTPTPEGWPGVPDPGDWPYPPNPPHQPPLPPPEEEAPAQAPTTQAPDPLARGGGGVQSPQVGAAPVQGGAALSAQQSPPEPASGAPQAQPQPTPPRRFTVADISTMAPGSSVQTRIGTVSKTPDGQVHLELNEVGKAKQEALRQREYAKFGHHPFKGEAGAPVPEIRVGASNFNAFTGKWTDGREMSGDFQQYLDKYYPEQGD